MKYIITAIISVLLILISTSISYTKGYSAGSNDIQNELNSYRIESQEQLRTREENYRNSLDELEQQMLKEQKTFNDELHKLNESYAEQLRKSEQRANYYRKLYSERNSSCDLSSHTARLDRALVQGTALVRELCQHIEYRDNQLRAIGQYLDMEKKLHE